jgi:hypothetical protein
MQFDRLSVTKGSVLVFKGELEVGHWEQFMDSLRERLAPLGLSDILIIHLGLDVEVEALDEVMMAQHGWVRAPCSEGT